MSEASGAEAMRAAVRRITRPHAGFTAGLLVICVAAAAVTGLVALVRDLPSVRARAALREGTRLVRDGEAAAAVRALLRAVAARPDDPEIHYYLGVAYARLGARQGALSQLQDAVRLAPGDPLAHDALGEAMREGGDVRAALREFETAARLEPREPRYRVHLAGALLDTRADGQAVARLREAAHLSPRSAAIRLLLGVALGRAGKRDAMTDELRAAGRLAAGGPLAEVAKLEMNASNTNEETTP